MRMFALVLLLCSQEKAPDATAIAEAEKTVRGLFKEDYAKKAAKDRVHLGQKLLEQARQTKDATASRYVLYREAQDALAQGGALLESLDAIEEWAKTFVIDAVDTKVKAVTAAAKVARTPEQALAVASAHLKIADAAVMADKFDVAEKQAAAAVAVARNAANVPALNRATAKVKEVAEQKTGFEKLKKSRDALAANPDDAEAALAVGRYQCFVKGDWAAGLPLLAKGSDAALKDLAAKDVAAPTDPAAMIEVADGWWTYATKAGPAKMLVRSRAVSWYDKALPKLEGLPRMKSTQRVNEHFLTQLYQGGTWVDIDVKSMAGKTGETEPPPSGYWYKVLNQVPSGSEYDAVSMRIRTTGKEAGRISMQVESNLNQLVHFDQILKHVRINEKEGGGSRVLKSVPLEPADEWTLSLILEDGMLAVLLNGRECFRVPTETRLVKTFRFDRLSGTYAIDLVRLRKKA
jgi:hypothetical protein